MSCVSMLASQAGLRAAGAGALLLVTILSVAHGDRGRLLALVSFGLAGALAYMALDTTFAAACGTSYQPITCAAPSGPGTTGYGIGAGACALVGAAILGLVRASRAPRESG